MDVASGSSTAQRNPFFKHAEAEYFLAWRDGRPVGRITAHVDRRFNEFQDNRWGLFGFFECEDDPETAHALLAAAEAWLRARGRDRMVGPMDFTTNDECGLLIEGHERPPMILSSWHHPYYQRLLEGDGLREGDGPADVEPAHQRPRPRARGDLADGRARSSPSTGSSCGRCASATSTPRSSASSRSTTPPGSATGRSCR